MRAATAAALSLLVVAAVAEPLAQLRLYHRVYHPLASQAPWLERGTVSISGNNAAAFKPSPTFEKDLTSFSEALTTVENTHLFMYQVALERPGDSTEAQWDYSSVKVCHLYLATSESIHLHTQHGSNPTPYSIDYFVSPTPHDGACPKPKTRQVNAQFIPPFPSFARNVNTTVILKMPALPPLPVLKTPPPLTTEGRPLEPLPEKTFLEKYWMYLVGAFMVIALTAGPEEPKKRE